MVIFCFGFEEVADLGELKGGEARPSCLKTLSIPLIRVLTNPNLSSDGGEEKIPNEIFEHFAVEESLRVLLLLKVLRTFQKNKPLNVIRD